MSETLAYSLSGDPASALSVNVPRSVLERMESAGAGIKIPTTRKKRVYTPMALKVMDDDSLQASVLNRRIGRMVPEHKYNALRYVVSFFERINLFRDPSEEDPFIDIRVGTLPINDGDRYGLDMTIKWPNLPEIEVARLGTAAMIAAATDLRYLRRPGQEREGYANFLQDLVGAAVSREAGVSIIALADASCTVDTDGGSHRPDTPTFDVYAHNLYSNEMQLICLTGGVAIAHADELATA